MSIPHPQSAHKPTIAIIQSCYIPWRGFFDFIDSVDHYYILDDAQFAKRHWHNRNQIKTPQGPLWLSIPVNTKGKFTQSIDETEITDPDWAAKHWQTIRQNYARAPYFKNYEGPFQTAYEQAARLPQLSAVNHLFYTTINGILNIQTPMTFTRGLGADGTKTDRLLSIAKAVQAGHYVSGPSARDYLEVERFQQADIAVSFMDYSDYAPYPQLWGDFEPAVSVLDLIFMTGPDARLSMKRKKSPWIPA